MLYFERANQPKMLKNLNIIWYICEKVLTLQPQNLKPMTRQHCDILISKCIRSFKGFERDAYVGMPQTNSAPWRNAARPFCFSNSADIS